MTAQQVRQQPLQTMIGRPRHDDGAGRDREVENRLAAARIAARVDEIELRVRRRRRVIAGRFFLFDVVEQRQLVNRGDEFVE